MPYITEESRNQIDDGAFPSNEGELNYMISSLLDEYLAEYGCNYTNIIKWLECWNVLSWKSIGEWQHLMKMPKCERMETYIDVNIPIITSMIPLIIDLMWCDINTTPNYKMKR